MKITKQFIRENINDEFLNYDNNTRMWGNEPTLETALLHWLSKQLPGVKYILTEQFRLKRWSKKSAVDMLYNAATWVNENAKDPKSVFNNGTPVSPGKFF